MSSYMKLFQDFVQKKENAVGRRISTTSLENDIDEAFGAVEVQHISADSLVTETKPNKMEHSYMRDATRPTIEVSTGLQPARTILVRRPPQCPSCHTHPLEEHELEDNNSAAVPSYNELASKEIMNECARIAKHVKNINSDEEDWEARVNQIGWSNMQKTLFMKVVRILDNDQLGRLAIAGRPNEAMQRRVIVDKSASRMRRALATVSWDQRVTQWMHSLLMDCLPPSYMSSYLDILQTLKTKLSTLMDKMLFSRPINVSQELLAPVMKKQWEPVISTKTRKLTQNAVIVALPSMPTSGPIPNRLQKWYQHLATITQIVQITLPSSSEHIARQPLEQLAEQIVSFTRVKIQELRTEEPTRSIILIGFNAGAAFALQVAMSEPIACVICMGFAYNTYNGVRGDPNDRILDIKIPILFVIGQNSARSSPEEIESLREKMISESSLVIVGSGDDVLRVPKSRRKIENVTQSMVDTMIVDEVYEFIKKILNNPPGPRLPNTLPTNLMLYKHNKITDGVSSKGVIAARKRKLDMQSLDPLDQIHGKQKYTGPLGRPRTRPLNVTTAKRNRTSTPINNLKPHAQQQHQQISSGNTISNDDLNLAMQSILGDTSDQDISFAHSGDSQKSITNFEIVSQPTKSGAQPGKAFMKSKIINNNANASMAGKIKMLAGGQFVQIKPPMQSQSKIYTIKPSTVLQQSQTQLGAIVATQNATNTTGQQQIFTLKSPNGQTTQFVTAAPAAAQQKYTVVKNAAGGTMLQLTSSLPPKSSQPDLSNIIDMPILFADNDGNISDAVGSPEPPKVQTKSTSGVGQLIISQKIIKEATPIKNTYMLSKPAHKIVQPGNAQVTSAGTTSAPTTNLSNKVVYINRSSIKPFSNINQRSQLGQDFAKFAKVVVASPGGAGGSGPTRLLTRPAGVATNIIKPVNMQPLKTPTSILNMSTKTLPQIQLVGSTNVGSATANAIAGDKPQQIRNIMVKPGVLKQIPPHLQTQLLSRNLPMRKMVNLVPASKQLTTNTTAGNSITMSNAEDSIDPLAISTTPVTVMQSSPKIITLNPNNPSAGASSD